MGCRGKNRTIPEAGGDGSRDGTITTRLDGKRAGEFIRGSGELRKEESPTEHGFRARREEIITSRGWINIGRRGRSGTRTHRYYLRCLFLRFSGDDPVVWIDKCLEYFHMYQVPSSLWVLAASIHMEQNAAR
jgi:hypothetical protein